MRKGREGAPRRVDLQRAAPCGGPRARRRQRQAQKQRQTQRQRQEKTERERFADHARSISDNHAYLAFAKRTNFFDDNLSYSKHGLS